MSSFLQRLLFKTPFRSASTREGALVVLILLTALALFYRDVVFDGHTFLIEGGAKGTMPPSQEGRYGPYGYTGPVNMYWVDQGSVGWQTEPFTRFASLSYQSGQLPLWNPYQGLGTPFYAHGMTGAFDPLRIPLYFTPTPWWPIAVDLLLLFRYFLAGLFTYLFLRTLGAGWIPALASSLAFMFCTYFLMYGNIEHIAIETLLPLLMLAYYWLAAKRSLGAFIVCVASVYLVTVGDFPEILPLYLGLSLLWFLFEAILIIRASPLSWHRFALKMAFLFISSTVLGLLLGAYILLPFAQMFLEATHVHNPALLPDLGLSSMRGFFLITRNLVGRLDIIPLALAAFGLAAGLFTNLDERMKKLFVNLLFFASVGIVAALVSYDVPVFGLIAHLPVLNIIVLGKYMQPIIAFLLACAAGLGLEFLLCVGLGRRLQRILYYAASLGGLTMLVAGVILAGQGTQATYAKVGASLVFAGVFALIFVLGVELKKITKPAVAGIFFVLAIVVEPAIVPNLLMERPVRYDPYTVPSFVAYLQQQPKPFRIVAIDDILYPNTSTAYQFGDIRYINALNPAVYDTYRRRFLESAAKSNDRGYLSRFIQPMVFGWALDLLNVKYILTTRSTPPQRADNKPPYELVYSGDGVNVFYNKNAYPRAFVVHRTEVIPDLDNLLNRLSSEDFDPTSTVLLQESPLQNSQTRPQSSAVPLQEAEVVFQTNNEMTIRATLDTPGLLVVSEQDYPGWEALVDGSPTHIYTADGMFRVVALESGSHTVEFRFRPPLFSVGLLAALLALLSLVLALVWRGFTRFSQYLNQSKSENKNVLSSSTHPTPTNHMGESRAGRPKTA